MMPFCGVCVTQADAQRTTLKEKGPQVPSSDLCVFSFGLTVNLGRTQYFKL